MGLNETDTRAKLIDPALHAVGWTEDLIRREETAGAIEIVDGKAKWQAKGRVDYTLRVKVQEGAQPVALALIEAKAEDWPRRTDWNRARHTRTARDSTHCTDELSLLARYLRA